MMHCASSSTAKLRLSVPSTSFSSSTPTATATDVSGGKLVCFHLGEVWEERGVDLGAVGRALGLDPASVQLNGYLLGARGPDYVAASVTWRSLLSFFSARGLPTRGGGCGGSGAPVAGDSAVDSPITVQGRPASRASLSRDQKFSGFCFHYDGANRSHQEGNWRTYSKRKLGSHHESPPGKEAPKSGQCSSSAPEDEEDGVSDSVLCIAKKLRLDDESPRRKSRKNEHDPGPAKLSALLHACRIHAELRGGASEAPERR